MWPLGPKAVADVVVVFARPPADGNRCDAGGELIVVDETADAKRDRFQRLIAERGWSLLHPDPLFSRLLRHLGVRLPPPHFWSIKAATAGWAIAIGVAFTLAGLAGPWI